MSDRDAFLGLMLLLFLVPVVFLLARGVFIDTRGEGQRLPRGRRRGEAITYRSIETPIIATALFAAMAVAAVPVGPLAASNETAWLIWGALVAGLSLVALRVWRVAVVVSPDGVVVRNFWRTVRVPWLQIQGIELGPQALFSWRPVTTLLLKNGTRLRTSAGEAPSPVVRPRNRGAQDLVEVLKGHLHESQNRSRRSAP